MTDPNDLGTWAGIAGSVAAIGMGGMAVFKKFFIDRADIVNSKSEVNMINELQTQNDKLVARLDAKDAQLVAVMEDKFKAQSDLNSALTKLELMSTQIEDLKQQIAILSETIKGLKS